MVADWAVLGKSKFETQPRLDPIRLAQQHRAMSRPAQSFEITADILLRAYAIGMFPMAESSDSQTLFWVDPKERGIFPLDGLILSKSLVKTLRGDRFEVRADENFDAVVIACANRDTTWINAEIRRLYRELFEGRRAHSIEVFEEGALVGGLYGVSLGASKVALAHLIARLRLGGYRLLDTQFVTPHLASLGAIEITRAAYLQMLEQALSIDADFDVWPASRPMRGSEVLAHLER
jgi:leucyl/phenylalanyl-tRNA---protein transferase